MRRDQPILVGEPPKGLYFIEKGAVFLTTEDHARFAELYEVGFFWRGFYHHVHRFYAMEDCSLLLLEKQRVLDEINREYAFRETCFKSHFQFIGIDESAEI